MTLFGTSPHENCPGVSPITAQESSVKGFTMLCFKYFKDGIIPFIMVLYYNIDIYIFCMSLPT